MTLVQSVRSAAVSGGVFAAALGLATLLTRLGSVPPIVAALAASLFLAVLSWKLDLPSPHTQVEFTSSHLASWSIGFIVPLVLLGGVARTLPPGSEFVCEPLVPWRISIVVFGSFFSACMAAGMRIRAPDLLYEALIPIALCWIAPFYGFFHAPWFLAQSLMIPCADRPIAQYLIAAAAMTLAALLGARLTAWMFDREA